MKASWFAEILWPIAAWYLADLASSGVFDAFAARGACSSALLCLVAPSLAHYGLLAFIAASIQLSASGRLEWITPNIRGGERSVLVALMALCAVTPVIVHWAGGRNMASQRQMVETYFPSMIVTFMLGAIVEEYVFRGVLQNRIEKIILSRTAVCILVSISWLMSHENFWRPSSFIVQAMALGLMLSAVSARFGILFAAVGHLVSNLALMAAGQLR